MTLNPIDHPVMFQVPDLAPSSAWIEHAPFGMLLVDLIRPRVIVELGVSTGASYCAFCQAVQRLSLPTRCFGVDTWDGTDEVLQTLKHHHDSRYGGFSQLIRATFDETVSMFADGSIDLLHIDGPDTSDSVSQTLAIWLPKMSDRGVVLLHGIAERSSGSSAWRLWDEISLRYPSFSLQHGRGLGLICVGSQAPEGLQPLFDFTESQSDAFRELCRNRGMQLRFLGAVGQEQSNSEKYDLIVANLEHRVAAADQTIGHLRLREQHVVERMRQHRVESEHLAATLNSLAATLNSLAWVESSRGVRVIKLARTTRHLMKQRGLLYALKRILAWSGGRRGYWRTMQVSTHRPEVTAPKPSPLSPQRGKSASLAAAPSVGVHVREQHLSTDPRFSGVSIVIPVFNALEFAKRCVSSIYAADSDIPFEIVVVDNGSRTDVLEWLRAEAKRHDNFWYVSLSGNTGYAKGINMGIKYSRGQYLMLSNSDILATPHWLDLMVKAMEKDASVGVLSPLTNYVGEGPQVDRRAAELDPEDINAYAASIRDDNTIQKVTNRLVFFCVMVRRQVAMMLGGLSDAYELGNYEDDDFCVRARMAGYKLAIARNTFVYHFGTKTFSTNQIDHSAYMMRNQIQFLDLMSGLSTELTPRTPRRAVTSPLVSVVVRTVNRPHALKNALASLANQTWEHFEVVIVCDGGPDISQLLETYSPYLCIRYVHNAKSVGRSEALNVGVKHASGKYITYLDDDDIVYPTHLETLVTTIQEDEDGAGFAYVDHNHALMAPFEGGVATVSRLPVPTWTYVYESLLINNHVPIHAWLHDRALWEEVGGFDTTLEMFEDWDFLIRIAQRRNFISAKRITCEYRFYLTGNNSMVTNRPETLRAMQAIYARYPATPILEDQRADMLQELRKQITMGDELLESAKDNGKSSESAVRELLGILVGFEG